MVGAEGVLGSGGNPERSVDSGAVANRADEARVRVLLEGSGNGARIGDAMRADFDLTGRGGDVERQRLGAIEPEQVKSVEWDGFAKHDSQASHGVAERLRFRNHSRHRRQGGRGCRLDHGTEPTVYPPGRGGFAPWEWTAGLHEPPYERLVRKAGCAGVQFAAAIEGRPTGTTEAGSTNRRSA